MGEVVVQLEVSVKINSSSIIKGTRLTHAVHALVAFWFSCSVSLLSDGSEFQGATLLQEKDDSPEVVLQNGILQFRSEELLVTLLLLCLWINQLCVSGVKFFFFVDLRLDTMSELHAATFHWTLVERDTSQGRHAFSIKMNEKGKKKPFPRVVPWSLLRTLAVVTGWQAHDRFQRCWILWVCRQEWSFG